MLSLTPRRKMSPFIDLCPPFPFGGYFLPSTSQNIKRDPSRGRARVAMCRQASEGRAVHRGWYSNTSPDQMHPLCNNGCTTPKRLPYRSIIVPYGRTACLTSYGSFSLCNGLNCQTCQRGLTASPLEPLRSNRATESILTAPNAVGLCNTPPTQRVSQPNY